MATNATVVESAKPQTITVSYEHPFVVRLAHWLNAVALFVMITSGLRIFRAFPSFGPKIPQQNFWIPPPGITLGGWLAGAIQWHFTFMWIFVGSGLMYRRLPDRHAAIGARCCSCRATSPACGRWCGITSSSARSRRSSPPTIRCRSWPTRRPSSSARCHSSAGW